MNINDFRDHLASHHDAKFSFLAESSLEELIKWHELDHTIMKTHDPEDLTPFRR